MSAYAAKRKEFMHAVNPFTARAVARALNKVTPGVVWTDCSKGHMAERWAEAQTVAKAAYHLPEDVHLKNLTLERLKELCNG
jgi:hypothetical protein